MGGTIVAMGLRIDSLGRRAVLRDATGHLVVPHVFIADGPFARAVGMLATPDPGPGEALVLAPCRAVHGVGLRARIGAAFVDHSGVVLRVVDPLPRRGASCAGAAAVVEAASGVLCVDAGERLVITDDTGFPLGGNFGRAPWGSTGRVRTLFRHRGHTAPARDRSNP